MVLAIVVASNQVGISLHNDYCDRVADATEKPERAIPRGFVSARAGVFAAALFAVFSLIVAAYHSVGLFWLSALATAAGWSYNAVFKASILSWLPFLMGFPALPLASMVIADVRPVPLWEVYLIGLPVVLAIHIADTLPDLEGDVRAGVRGLAHRLGFGRALLACWSSVAIAIAAALVMRPAGGMTGAPYVLPAGLLVLAIVAGRPRIGRIHWIAIMLACVSLIVVWLVDATV